MSFTNNLLFCIRNIDNFDKEFKLNKSNEDGRLRMHTVYPIQKCSINSQIIKNSEEISRNHSNTNNDSYMCCIELINSIDSCQNSAILNNLTVYEFCEKEISKNHINKIEDSIQECNNSYYFISFISVTIANSSDKTNIEIKVKHQRMLKKSKDKNKCLNTFDLQRDLLKRSCSNNSYLKNKRYIGAISYKTHLYVYILLFSFCCIAKICNQILQVERSISLNDSRLSNIAHIVIDILHTICSAIPLFCPCYKYNEKIIDSTNFNGDEFVFISLLQYILLSLALIIIHRFLLLGIKELRSWIKFIKLLILFYSFCFICRNYAISFILKVGAINLLFIMNISCNIISKKTVTEDLLTVTLKFILYAISPTILIKNNYYKCLEIRDLITCLPSLRVDVSNMKSYNFYDSIKINQQRLIIQIVMILILFLQKKYGSLFFLPSCFRTKIYESMAKDIRQFSQTEIEKSCTFCTNLLWQRELIYSDDSDQDLNTTNSRVLYETKCGLIYHHRCFFKSLTGFPNCPHCGYTIPKDEWDD